MSDLYFFCTIYFNVQLLYSNLIIMRSKAKGVWFYGLSGRGKSYASNIVFKQKKNSSVLIDGDVVRKLISTDLGYSKKDRVKQIKRLIGMARMCIKSKKFPIVSCVYLDKNFAKKIKNLKIKLVEIVGNNTNTNRKLKGKKNVVGVDILLPKINCLKVYNEINFKKKIKKLI